MAATTSTGTGTTSDTPGLGVTVPKKDPNFTMTLQNYEQSFSRIMSQRGVRGIAVTSRNGGVTYYNNHIPVKTVEAYTKAVLDSEYPCTSIARQNDPLTRLYYIRVETTNYEMVVSVENTHLTFMFCDTPEVYNGENLVDGDDDDD